MAAAIFVAAGCARAAPPAAVVPAVFHGVWVEDALDCRDLRQVRMIVGRHGYRREEIDALPIQAEMSTRRPARARITFASLAEGHSWTSVEEWSISSTRDGLKVRTFAAGELPDAETSYVRCRQQRDGSAAR
jgi:hypothetical protein